MGGWAYAGIAAGVSLVVALVFAVFFRNQGDDPVAHRVGAGASGGGAGARHDDVKPES
ncbi:MAG: hypothetical protein IT373_21575 [Polyangiaceae bacterium]|nr:hypothetical protein [Polyangiaceae bacterium]